ncbi:MAG: hypothetical protein JSU05_14870 [Bacteroidetes bacterium]|nr:hypothetical protein [Bacteroidota bacterium]
MKRIFTFSITLLTATIFLSGCMKQDVTYIDEGYWLSQERGVVVYSNNSCDYYVVETNYGYSLMKAFNGYKPYQGSTVYGDFSSAGIHDFYNRSYGVLFSANEKDYWLSNGEAQSALDYYYCY